MDCRPPPRVWALTTGPLVGHSLPACSILGNVCSVTQPTLGLSAAADCRWSAVTLTAGRRPGCAP